MFSQQRRLGINNKDFKWWIRELPQVLTKQDLKDRYALDNLNIVGNDNRPISINDLVEIAKKNSKTVI